MARQPDNSSQTSEEQQPSCSVPAGAPGWVTVELMEQTWRVWQPYYREPLNALDLLEMILGVGRMLDLLSQGTDHETVRRVGPSQQS